MQACLTCSEPISDEKLIYHLTDIYFDSEESHVDLDITSIKEKLSDCIPEFLLDDVVGAVLCQSCASSVTAAYKFKQKCLEVQFKRHGYLQEMPKSTEIKVTEISNGEVPMNIDIGTTIERQTLESPSATIVDEDEIEEVAKVVIIPTLVDGKIQYVPVPTWLLLNLVDRFIYSCNVCRFICKPFSKFCIHMIAHDNIPDKCIQCEFTSADADVLEAHMKNHKKEKREYVCTLCGLKTYSRRLIINHSFHHEQAFQCHICKWGFPNKIEIAMHMKDHSRFKILNCKHCSYKCYIQESLHKHMNNHKIKKCSLCSFETLYFKTMKKHMSNEHKYIDEVV